MMHAVDRFGKLSIVLGLVNLAVYLVLSYFSLFIPRGVGWLRLLGPSGYQDLYRIVVGLLVHVAASSAQIALFFALTRSLAITLGNRVAFLAHLWLVGLENFDESSLVKEVAVLAAGLYLSKHVSRVVPRERLGLGSRVPLLPLHTHAEGRVLRATSLERNYGLFSLILSFHGIAASLLVLYTVLLFSVHNYKPPLFTLVVAYVIVPLVQLAIALLAHHRVTSPLQPISMGLSSGMGLLGVLPFIISITSARTPRVPRPLPKQHALAEQKGLFLGLALAELKSGATGEDWYWSETSFPFYVDLEKLNTPHIVVVGASGTGKTSLAKHVIREMRRKYGYTLIVIDPHGEYGDIARELGFRVIDASSSSVNPLALGNSSPADRAMQVSHVISTIFNLGPLQRRMLEEVVLEAYNSKGIRQDDPSTWTLEPPTMKDLVEVCKSLIMKSPEFHRVLPYLEMLSESLSARTWISIDEVLEHNSVVDLSRVASDFARALFVDTFMYLLLSKMYTMKSEKVQLVIDEARSLMPRAVTREILNRLFVESRKFGFSIMVISQEIRRLPRDLINNAGMRIFFLLNEPRSLEEASRILSGAGPRKKFTTIAEALRTLEPYTFIVHVTGSGTMYILRSPSIAGRFSTEGPTN